MKHFDTNFKQQLIQTIADIENNSQVEIVVVIKPTSNTYLSTAMWWGIFVWFVTFTMFIFSPWVFGNYTIYIGTIFAFVLGTYMALTIKPLLRISVRQQTKTQNVELKARAIFQKIGIRHTRQKIGVLIYISVFERMVYILPDRGAMEQVPADEWTNMQSQFDAIFNATNKANACIDTLKNTLSVFNKYIPPVENDLNELPDYIEDIEL